MATAVDTFVDVAGTGLHFHIPTPSGTGLWGYLSTGTTNSAFQITATNTVRGTSTSSAQGCQHSLIPAGVDQDIQVDIVCKSTGAGLQSAGVIGRYVAGPTFYHARYSHTSKFELVKMVAGVATVLGTYTGLSLTAGQTATILLQIRDASKKVFINGIERISSSDNAITDVGRVGVRGFTSTTSINDTTGIHLDNWEYTDPVSAYKTYWRGRGSILGGGML